MNINSRTIGFIGNGNMANALVAGLIKQGQDPQKIGVAGPDAHKLARFEEKYGVWASQQNEAVIEKADIAILAVKPQVLANVAKALAVAIHACQPLVISIAAGVRLATINSWLGKGAILVRAMPNLPTLVQQGVTVLYAPSTLSPQSKQEVDDIFTSVGTIVWIGDEDDLDKVTALSGSGPAYFFWILRCLLEAMGNGVSHQTLISELLGEPGEDSDGRASELMLLVKEALKEAGCSLGLPYSIVHQLVEQTARGSFYLAQRSQHDLATLVAQVTSKGGTTEAGLEILAAGKLVPCFQQALESMDRLDMEYLKALFGDTLRAAWLRAQVLGLA